MVLAVGVLPGWPPARSGCTHGAALRWVGEPYGMGQRGEGWSGGDEWAGWTRVMTGALCAPSRNEKMQE